MPSPGSACGWLRIGYPQGVDIGVGRVQRRASVTDGSQPAVTASTPVLDQLRAVPGSFGQPTFANLLAAILADARAQSAAGAPPPTLFVMGEPLAGKSTFLSQLFVRLVGPHPP